MQAEIFGKKPALQGAGDREGEREVRKRRFRKGPGRPVAGPASERFEEGGLGTSRPPHASAGANLSRFALKW